MKFIIAPGKYGNHISSKKIGQAIYSGISRALPSAEIVTMPVTDSKYGMPALVEHTIGGKWVKLSLLMLFGKRRRANIWLLALIVKIPQLLIPNKS